ncbi:MAG: hypothetical protein JWN02_2678 [Acidobacteria bacterium]|nr:hypothetical protein [Acidobacteriota bacterium]
MNTINRVLLFLLWVAFLLLATSCRSASAFPSEPTTQYLKTANDPASDDLSVRILDVLQDIERKTYRYDDLTRTAAFDAIARLRPNDEKLLGHVRTIAQMSLDRDRSYRQLWDYVAITGALDLLARVNDSRAGALNENRLTDPLLVFTATNNLHQLKSWTSTPKVVAAFLMSRELSSFSSEDLTLVSLLRFLSESPSTSVEVCALLQDYLRPPSNADGRAGEVLMLSIELRKRLGCRGAI